MKLVVFGLSLSSSWGNGHATTFRALLSAFAQRGHDILFLERNVPWYADHRDLAQSDYCRLAFYDDLADLENWRSEVAAADAVIVGSYVPDGIAVGHYVMKEARGAKAFYDIDTPVTLAALRNGSCEYLSPDLIQSYDLYCSFTGGPTLSLLEREYGSPMARALHCSVDIHAYRPQGGDKRWDLSYLGTYSPDRQPTLEKLLIEPARMMPEKRFVVAGSQYPADIDWPSNVERIDHLPPSEHAAFYSASRYTLNVTRADMIKAGWSPSVRLFEAAACGTPIISDIWPGLNDFFQPNREILFADKAEQIVVFLDEDRPAMGDAARSRILVDHSAQTRAAELEQHLMDAAGLHMPAHFVAAE